MAISGRNMKVQLRVQPLLVHSPDGQSAAGAILIRVLVLILILILLLTGSPTNPFNISTAEAGQASSPDLVVSSVTNPPASVNAGAGFAITDTTGNSGSATANPSVTRFRLSLDATITSSDPLLTGTRSVPTLKKGSSSSGSTSVIIPANLPLGTYYLGACADDTGLIAESSESNNCRASTTTVTITAPINFTASPSSIAAGDRFAVSWSQIGSPTNRDWIGLYTVGAANSAYLVGPYLNCSSSSPPSTPIPSGSCTFNSTSLTPGNYEFRLFTNDTFNILAISNTVAVSPPLPASQLAILNLGYNPSAGAPGFTLGVQSQTAHGTAAAVVNNTAVRISLKTGTGVLAGTLTGTIPAGSRQVSIGSVTYTKAESGVVLTATATSGDSLAPGDSAPFTVDSGQANNLAFITQPGSSQAGSVVSGPPTVVVRDSLGNTVTSSAAPITIAIANPPYGVLNGTRTKNASGGVATFNDLNINQVGDGYTLAVSSSGLSGATSNAFSITVPMGNLGGTVTRASDGSPISGALVEAVQADVVKGSATSSVNGSYSIPGLQTGIYNIRASAGGYITQLQSDITIALGSTATANFSLTQERIVYLYDALTRLRAVVDLSGDTATYSYDAVGNLLGISRHNSSQVSVIEFSPNSGTVGTTVTIYGTGFSAAPSQNAVTFSGVPATVISSTATQIVATVPSGATTGPIGVTAPPGSAASSAPFIVTSTSSNGRPTITSFTPTIGTLGTAVTVNGTNFDTIPGKNDLRLNVGRGAISSSTGTSISTTVPPGTGSGRISVTTALGKGISNGDFFIPPSSYTTSDIEFTGRLAGNGTPLNLAINTSNKKGLIVFDGTAGQRISLRVTNSTFPWPCPWCINVNLQFYRPDGLAWVSTSWTNSSSAFFESPLLPVSGTYTILFDPQAGNTGQATLALYDISGEAQGTLTSGSPVTASVSIPGQNISFVFTGTAGQRVSLTVTDANFTIPCAWCQSAFVYIIKPDGQVLAQGTWANGTGTFIDTQTLPISGTYTVRLDPTDANTGRATITLYNLPPDDQGAITVLGPPVTVTTTMPGQRARLTFTGTPGQRVSIGATNMTIPRATIAIYDPNSTLLASGSVMSSESDRYVVSTLLSSNGTYSILVDPDSTGIGSMTLRADVVSLSETPISIARGGTVTATWNGVALPIGDWIGLFVPGGTTSQAVQFTGSTASGSMLFTIPATVTPGTYELRFHSSNYSVLVAISDTFTVTGP